MTKLPPGQRRILTYFANAEDEGRQASREEIAEACGYAFPSAVTKHVDALVRKGLLSADPHKKRNVRLTDDGWESLGRIPLSRGVPIIGHIAAGVPILASEQHEGYLEDVTPRRGRFALRIRGDSMTGADIHDGDYAIIDSTRKGGHNDIGAVVVEDEATLKRVRYRKHSMVLIAENPAYEPLVIRDGSDRHIEVVGPLALIVRTVA